MGKAVELLPVREVVEEAGRGFGEAPRYRYELVVRGRIERGLVEEISRAKKEPGWMRRLRLRALELFEKLPPPRWLPGLAEIDVEEVAQYVKPGVERVSDWDELPAELRRFYEGLGLPEIEARFLAGLTLTLDSEAIMSRVKQWLRRLGVVFLPMEEALRRYPDLVQRYFSRIFPPGDHKFAALHYALWSGGAFVYVPPGVRVPQPVEAFFVIGRELEGQFEHTIVVAGEGSSIHFIEGCSAPIFKRYSFHDGAVEVYAHRRSSAKFSTVQNWSRNVVNMNNKRAIAEEGSYVEWLEGSIGSRATYTYPSTILMGRRSSTRNVSVSIVNGPYIKDVGGKAIHVAPETRSEIVSKSVSAGGGLAIYRGLVKVVRGAERSVAHVSCDSLILDDESRAYTYPRNEVDEPSAEVGHEATTGRLGVDRLLYLMTRGLSEGEARALVVLGFIRDVLQGLPLEYASMLGRVVELEFSEVGGVG